MKKILAFFVVIIVLYSVYFDLNVGTLSSTTRATEIKTTTVTVKPSSPFKTVNVKPGDTVLTVVERLHKGAIPVSIDQVIKDFNKLNKGIKPEEIQIGQIYKFPVYP